MLHSMSCATHWHDQPLPEHNSYPPTLLQNLHMMRLTHLLVWVLASLSYLAAVVESDIVEAHDGARTLRGNKPTGGKGKCGKKPCPTTTSCPVVSPAVNGTSACAVKGQKCTFEYSSTIPGGVCQNKDVCTCKKGKWNCAQEIGCVDDNPPVFEECPDVSPTLTKDFECFDTVEQQCIFGYSANFPGEICQVSETCTCKTGTWVCLGSKEGCVSDNAASVTSFP
jgi:hypothetical protein